MQHLFLIAIGGALGAVARHGVNQASLRWIGPELPWGILAVNVLGSFAIGLLVGWLALAGRPEATEIRFAVGIGFLGAFTTMSAFALDIVLMIERREFLTALAYGGGTVIVSVLAVFAGLFLIRTVMA
ncbi:putative fluoride ion transporter CrcB [Glycocaulis albus]|uniref:Fluoride-specific ion channel FluC n=1 Tax=Glycocaulis albus TaxID=1382801 RepID=A0ABQ1XZP2_9PROT|nr:fluoride efflux transporter CrcB [Glycocaulis albus]GGH07634.1 putative fluoride ion transporter CrcB [Glycocaulis albus]